MYLEGSTPLPGPSKSISLSLHDLVSSNLEVTPQNQSAAYKRELAKLLVKSKGTAYEATLKRFVESKYREIKADEHNNVWNNQDQISNLSNLSNSRYDTDHFDGCIIEVPKTTEISIERLAELAKPKASQVWKVFLKSYYLYCR